MNKQFWERMADRYDEEIFDTLKCDRRQVIRRYIHQSGARNATAIDFGCGVGKYLPLLAEHFKRVVAIDLSSRCLERARYACRALRNIEYIRGDMAAFERGSSKARFALCVNMLIMPAAEKRLAILKGISRHVQRRGNLLLVAPSLESALLTHQRLRAWNRRSRMKDHRLCAVCDLHRSPRKFSVADGLLNLDGVSTKHFLKEELVLLLDQVGYDVLSVRKVEYPWATELSYPPRWMKAPYPWDWMLLCRKR